MERVKQINKTNLDSKANINTINSEIRQKYYKVNFYHYLYNREEFSLDLETFLENKFNDILEED